MPVMRLPVSITALAALASWSAVTTPAETPRIVLAVWNESGSCGESLLTTAITIVSAALSCRDTIVVMRDY